MQDKNEKPSIHNLQSPQQAKRKEEIILDFATSTSNFQLGTSNINLLPYLSINNYFY